MATKHKKAKVTKEEVMQAQNDLTAMALLDVEEGGIFKYIFH